MGRGALVGSRLLPLGIMRLSHLRVAELGVMLRSTTRIVNLDIRMIVACLFFLVILVHRSAMDGVLPTLVELRIFPSDVIV